MAKRIAIFAESGKSVEAIPHDNTYPTGAVTLAEDTSKAAGDYSLYSKTDVSDSFHSYGQADIYINGVFVKTVLYAPELGALDQNRVGEDELYTEEW